MTKYMQEKNREKTKGGQNRRNIEGNSEVKQETNKGNNKHKKVGKKERKYEINKLIKNE
jgi:hypothetical protein